MPESSDDTEAVVKELFSKVKKNLDKIKNLQLTDLSEEDKLGELKKLKISFIAYNLCFADAIKAIPDYKKTLYERQKDLLKNTCVKVVEDLGFCFETDFCLGLELEEDNSLYFSDVEDESPCLNRTQSVIELDLEAKETPTKLNRTQSQLNLDTTWIKSDVIDTTLLKTAALTDINYKMANFERKEANQLIPEFDGSHEKLITFLRRCENLNKGYKDETEKRKFLDFVIDFKLSGAVLNKFGTEKIPTTFEEFKKTIFTRFSDKTTEVTKTTELEKITQKDKLTDFCTEIETLAAQLVELKLNSYSATEKESARPFIKVEVDKLAVRQLISGIKRAEVKQAVVFKDPTTLSEAITSALQADSKFKNTPEEFEVNGLRFQESRNYNQSNWNRYQRNQNGSERYGTRANDSRFNPQPTQQQQNYRNWRPVEKNQGNYGDRYFYNQNYRNGSNRNSANYSPRYNERYGASTSRNRTNQNTSQGYRNQNESDHRYRNRNQNVRNYDHYDDERSWHESEHDPQEGGFEGQNGQYEDQFEQNQGNFLGPQQINRVVVQLRDVRN